MVLRWAPADWKKVGQRLSTFAAACAVAAVLSTAAAGAPGLPDWAAPQIKTVVAHKLMGAKSLRIFHPNAPLTNETLTTLAADLKKQLGSTARSGSDSENSGGTTTTGAGTTTTGTTTGSNPAAQDTIAQLDRSLVQAIGLGRAAKEFLQGARAEGIPVPGYFGTEVVARLLGLRYTFPAAEDYLALRPQDPATRAEAAYSAAQILGFGRFADNWQITQVKNLAAAFTLPQLNTWQGQILAVAFSKIGMPYVWGGTRDGTETDFGITARGGYDCSGFVWRVYKLQSYPGEGTLASTIQGRTSYAMSVEVPQSERITFKNLQPADLIFFGSNGSHSTGSQVFHTAIYVGNGWFIHSSDEGVALAQLAGWYRQKFAWGRRPLREAGLEP